MIYRETEALIHSVAFKLKHQAGSEAESKFLQESWDRLSVIPGVEDFMITRQISQKNPYDFEFEMTFKNQADYDAYNVHPKHWDHSNDTGYVPDLWFKEVDKFLEKDTKVLIQMDQEAIQNDYIHHTVAFKLKHTLGSEEEARFLEESWHRLSLIPGVKNFAVKRQVSTKNPYDFELTMDFASQADYHAYNVHPNHYDHSNTSGYVPDLWLKEVLDYLEKDTVIYKKD